MKAHYLVTITGRFTSILGVGQFVQLAGDSLVSSLHECCRGSVGFPILPLLGAWTFIRYINVCPLGVSLHKIANRAFLRGNGRKFGFEHFWLLRRLLSSHRVCCVEACGSIPAKRAQLPAKRAQIPAKQAQLQIM